MTREPYFDESHRALAQQLREFGDKYLRASGPDEADPAGRTKDLLRHLANAHVLEHAVPAPYGTMDLRSLVAARETLAYFSSLADTAFAMQGLGSYPLVARGHRRAEEPLAAGGRARHASSARSR